MGAGVENKAGLAAHGVNTAQVLEIRLAWVRQQQQMLQYVYTQLACKYCLYHPQKQRQIGFTLSLSITGTPTQLSTNPALSKIRPTSTIYTRESRGDPDGNGQAIYMMNVLKHNCRSPGLFCDPEVAAVTGPTCQPIKELKKSCRFDAECASVRGGLVDC